MLLHTWANPIGLTVEAKPYGIRIDDAGENFSLTLSFSEARDLRAKLDAVLAKPAKAAA